MKNKHLKGFVALFLAGVMLCPSALAAVEVSKPVLNVMYDDFATNSVPEKVLGTDGTKVIEKGTKNKVLRLACDSGGGSATYSIAGTDENFIAEAEVVLPEELNSFKISIKNASATFELLSFGDKGGFLLDGKKYSTSHIRRDKNLKIGLKIDKKKSRYSLYVNGNCIVANYKSNSAFGELTELVLQATSNEEEIANIYVDNVRVYNGVIFSVNFPKIAYSYEILEEEIPEDPTQTEVVEGEFEIAYKENFEKHFNIESFRASAKVTKNEKNVIDLHRDETGNQYLTIERTTSDPYVDIYVPIKGSKYILEVDIASNDVGGPNKSMGMNQYTVIFRPGGAVTLADGTEIGKLKATGFTNIALAVDPVAMTYQVYIDRKPASKVIKCTVSPDNYQCRFYCYNGGGTNSIMIDNIAVYPGDKLVDVEAYGGWSRDKYISNEQAIAQGGEGSVSFHTHSQRAVVNGERVEIGQAPVIENDKYYVPEKLIKTAYNADVKIKGSSVSVNGITVNGMVKDGAAYAEIGDLCKNILNLNYYTDTKGFGYNKGFGIIGTKDFSAFENDFMLYNELNNYLVYERPEAEEILKTFKEKSANVHPRLLATEEDFTKLKRELQNNAQKKAWADKVVSQAEGQLSAAVPSLALNGPRLSSIHSMQAPIFNLCLAYKITGDSRFAEKIWIDLKTMGDRANWNQWHFLDIGVGTTPYALAYDWLYDYWTDDRRVYLEKTILEKSLTYYYNSIHNGEYTSWIDETVQEGNMGNWPIVCSSGPVMAALALMDVYPEMCSAIVSDGFRSIEYTMKGYADDGDWTEGLMYWAFSSRYLSYLIGSCDTALGTDYGYYEVPGMKNTCMYYYSLMGATAGFNFGDASGTEINVYSVSWHASKWQREDPEFALNLFKMVNKYYNINNMNGDMWDILKMDNRRSQGEPEGLTLEYYSDKMGLGIMRSAWNFDNETYLGYVRGTKERMSHEHVDHGSFVFDSMGTRWAYDLGSDNYEIKPYETAAYRMRAEAHNVYVINPDEGVGQLRNQYGNYNVRKEHNNSSYYSIEDLTSSYADWVTSARRGYKLTDDMKSLIVRDEIELKEDNSEFMWFMTTKADVKIDGNTAILTDGTQMKFEFISNQPLELSTMDCVSMETSAKITSELKDTPNVGYTKLVLKGKASGKLTVAVKLTPFVDGVEFSPLTDVSFDNWTLDPETVKSEPPVLDGISIDGEKLVSFKPDVHSYSWLAVKSENEPVVEAVSQTADVVVKKGADSKYIILVKDKANPCNFITYTLTITEFNSPNVGAKYKLINPAGLSVSEQPQAANAMENAMDGDLTTRWSAEGEQWIMQEFDKEYEVSAVDLAWHEGDKRIASYKIQYSLDGEEFITLVDTKSSGTTSNPELNEFTPVKAKYIRILANGTSISAWNSITEFYIYRNAN